MRNDVDAILDHYILELRCVGDLFQKAYSAARVNDDEAVWSLWPATSNGYFGCM